MISRIPKEVVDILKVINKHNYEGFIIGGAVRDVMLNKTPKDYDICTDMPLEELQKVIPHFHLMKKTSTRNTGIVIVNQIPIEISTYKGNTLKEDILKRDFTINGIALSRCDGPIDYFGFRNDIYNKQIRLIDKINNSLQENPLIILRALRLSKQLGFEIEPNTKERISTSSDLLKTIKQERIAKELLNLLVMDDFDSTYKEYSSIFNTIIPEITILSNTKLNKTLKLVNLLHNNHILRLAALFLYTDNNIEQFKQVALRLHFDKKTIKGVITLLKYAKIDLKPDKKSILALIREVNIQNVALLFAFKYAFYTLENKNTSELAIDQALYQKEIDEITQMKIKNLSINISKIEEMGYSSTESAVIYETIKGKIINNELPNSENSLKPYILKHYKRS